MTIGIGRRRFISGVGGTAVAWPLVVHAQQPSMPVIGWLYSVSAETGQPTLAAFRKALGEGGYVEGRNVAFEYRWANGNYERLPAMAAELVARQVTLIVTGGGEPSVLAAKAATSTIPIVMVSGTDPVREGLVASLNRPGGNITGATVFASEMESKRLGLLHEAVPAAKAIAVLLNPANPAAELQARDVRDAAPRVGVEVIPFSASTESEFDDVFAAIIRHNATGLLVAADPFFNSRRPRLIALAAAHRLPAIYEWRLFAVDGGLMSYATVLTDAFAQAGTYAARILNGETPTDLPVVLPTNFEFVINLKTAKSLGVDISPTLSARADEVIE
jgi:putative ABC transport system substrate-binding protein